MENNSEIWNYVLLGIKVLSQCSTVYFGYMGIVQATSENKSLVANSKLKGMIASALIALASEGVSFYIKDSETKAKDATNKVLSEQKVEAEKAGTGKAG